MSRYFSPQSVCQWVCDYETSKGHSHSQAELPQLRPVQRFSESVGEHIRRLEISNTLIFPSCIQSLTEKYRTAMCFVPG